MKTFTIWATALCLALTLLPVSTAHAGVSGFVTRTGNRLSLNGAPFRFSGANLYWLGLDENVSGVAYPTQFRVDDALSTAAEMGASVVRAHTLGISVGNSLSVEPTLGTFNSAAFQSMDYAVKSAGDHGIRLIIPLTDNYNYYTGGKATFTSWRGDSNANDFYTNGAVIGDFQQYVSAILNHVNTYTGVAYKDDPTIMAWETGNEINPPVSWTQTMANYIKGIDNQHLVVDGSYGVNTGALTLANVDIYSDHYYPLDAAKLANDANAATGAGKVFLAGEYAWNNGDLAGFLSTAEQNANVAGDFYWSLFGHLDTYGFVQHNDGYTMHYPGDSGPMQTGVQQLRTHAYAMRGQAAPAAGLPLTPAITNIDSNGYISWRGAALGATYAVERSTAGASGPWTTLTSGSVTDNNTPWQDAVHPSGQAWYRVKAANLSGAYGPYSAVSSLTYSSGGGTSSPFTDPLNDFSLVCAKTAGWAIDTSNAGNFNGDAGRADRTTTGMESLTYNKSGITGFTVRMYDYSSQAYTLTLAVSPDNSTWTAVAATTSASGNGAANWTYTDAANSGTIPAGMNYLRLTLSGSGQSWAPQISQITINYGAAAVPGAPTLNTATAGNGSVALAWSAPASGGAPASYTVKYGTSSGTYPFSVAGISGTSKTVSGLTNGTAYYFVVCGVNAGGTGAASNVKSATPLGPVTLVDPLNDFSQVSSRSGHWSLDTSNASYFGGDASRADRSTDTTEFLVYQRSNISALDARVYTKAPYSALSAGAIRLYSSTNNGASFQPVSYSGGSGVVSGGGWTSYDLVPAAALPAGTNALKIEFNAGAGNAWDPQLSQMSITYGP